MCCTNTQTTHSHTLGFRLVEALRNFRTGRESTLVILTAFVYLCLNGCFDMLAVLTYSSSNAHPTSFEFRFVSFSITASSYEIITQFESKSFIPKPWPNDTRPPPPPQPNPRLEKALFGFGLLCVAAFHIYLSKLKMTLESMPGIITLTHTSRRL